MGLLPTLAITSVLAIFIVLLIVLLSYVSNLAKHAYDIKIELRQEMKNGLKALNEDMDKRSRWMKREVTEDLERDRQAQDNRLEQRLQTVERELREAVEGLNAEMQRDRHGVATSQDMQDARIAALEREIKRLNQMLMILQSLIPEAPRALARYNKPAGPPADNGDTAADKTPQAASS